VKSFKNNGLKRSKNKNKKRSREKNRKKKDSFRVTASNMDAIVGARSGVCTYAKRRTYLVFRIKGETFFEGMHQRGRRPAQSKIIRKRPGIFFDK